MFVIVALIVVKIPDLTRFVLAAHLKNSGVTTEILALRNVTTNAFALGSIAVSLIQAGT